MASNTVKLFLVSEDSTVVEKIQQWANVYDHEVTFNSTIPEDASVIDLNAVNFIIIDGNVAHKDHYDFLELVSNNTPVVVIGDINDDNSHEKNIEALKKGAIDYWYSIGQETYKKIDSLIAKKTLSTSKKRKSEVAGEAETSSAVEVIGGVKKRVIRDSPPAGLYHIEGGGTIRYVETPRLPKKP
ncbi:hypothetical protein P8452_01277 [Trifolium repens]|nr:hypothetical protein P8452_01277 [Trifolium repens]